MITRISQSKRCHKIRSQRINFDHRSFIVGWWLMLESMANTSKHFKMKQDCVKVQTIRQ